jgi:hypothetical protein
VSIGVQCRPTDAAAVSAQLPFGWDPISPTEAKHKFILEAQPQNDRLFSIRRESSGKASAPQPFDAALKTLQKEIHLCVAEHASHHVFIHAGVVVWNNRAIVLPGFSHAGKSTLVWSFVKAGAIYYSDEYAVFDEEGCISPFALPISLRMSNGERHLITPDSIGASRRKPDFIVFTRYRTGAIWRPRQLQPGSAVLGLIRHSIAIRRNPALVLRILKNVSLQSQAFQGPRGEPSQLLAWIETIDSVIRA